MTDPVTLLSLPVQRWLYRKSWKSLRPIQVQAIAPILSKQDLILAAGTASGKTEAAFLPILSYLHDHIDSQEVGCQVLYVAPLKALINDQARRLELLTEGMDIPVTPWHGDIQASKKSKFKERPDGVLMITPESLEAMMVNYGPEMPRRFHGLQFIVVDELHAYLGTERGQQLQSLLHRLEYILGRTVPRIGLSATLGDLSQAAAFLCPDRADRVVVITDKDSGQSLKLQLRAYVRKETPDPLSSGENKGKDNDEPDPLALHLYRNLRGDNHLIFTNTRAYVEVYADRLRALCKKDRIPNEFLPHHGSLSKELREYAESEIKKDSRPVSIICTSTMEMGIDIGVVKSIAQIGTPFNVASLRQRLGRSGRRGDPAALRVYVEEQVLSDKAPFTSRLRENVFQATAVIDLLLSGWVEPADLSGLHLSTLIQQILSAIAQTSGATAHKLWEVLCGPLSPFSQVKQEVFIRLLRDMGSQDLIIQSSDGALLHGCLGEQLVNHYKFYAAFETREEYTLRLGSRLLGTLPIDQPLFAGAYILFAGRRWQITEIDDAVHTIYVQHAKGGRPPKFGGSAGIVDNRIRERMYDLYCSDDIPQYLDREAQHLLVEGRQAFHTSKLDTNRLLTHTDNTYFFLWKGDKVNNTLVAMLANAGIAAGNEGLAVCIQGTSASQALEVLERLASDPAPDPQKLSGAIENKQLGKYDNLLSEELLNVSYASHRLDVTATMAALKESLAAQRNRP